jgi:flagellin
VLGVAEGAYNSILDNLIEMKSLATQAANGTIGTGSNEMGYIASQLEALGTDINDIAASTKYNGIDLMNAAASLTFQVGEGTNDTMAVSLSELNMGTLFTNSGTDETVASAEGLGDASNGGTPANASNGGANTHISKLFEADGANDSAISAAQGTSIGVRGQATAGTAVQDRLYIDEATVNAADMRSFITHIDSAIGTMNSNLNQIGIDQSSLSGKEVNLSEAITANSAARSRIMDTDFAKEQSNSIRLQILQQTATAALSQANMGPQAVLGFLG